VENLGDMLPDRLARFRCKLLGKLPQLLVLGGCGVESLRLSIAVRTLREIRWTAGGSFRSS
jgi:hypothetical protein